MRTLLMLVLALLCGTAQAAIFPNSYNTNATGRTPNVLPTSTNSIYPLMVLNPDGSGVDRQVLYSPYIFLLGSNLFVNGAVVGNGGGGATTNYYSTIITTNLTVLNQLTVSNISVTNITVQNNLTVSNLYTVNGNHNTLIVSNALTLQTIKTNVLATTSSGLITNANYGTGLSWDPTTLTLSASGAGNAGSTNYRSAVISLTTTGTNVNANQIDFALTNQCYRLTLTNNAFFGTAVCTNVPATNFFQWVQLDLVQDATGARLVQFDPAGWVGVNGTFPFTTNASSWDTLGLINSRVTNGMVAVLPVNNLR